jgi:hypothetical protein
LLDQLEEETARSGEGTKPISFDRSLQRCVFQFAELSLDRHAIPSEPRDRRSHTLHNSRRMAVQDSGGRRLGRSERQGSAISANEALQAGPHHKTHRANEKPGKAAGPIANIRLR